MSHDPNMPDFAVNPDDSGQRAAPSPLGKFRGYLELFRLPNVFTAAADVMMGFFFTHPLIDDFTSLGLLVAASCLLYTAGMVLNDVFDYAADLAERPFRPLPSGRVQLNAARLLGFLLLVAGAGCGWGAGLAADQMRSGVVATGLAAAVFMYDRILKRTPLGPVGMGACRFLNVLLGMSAGGTWYPVHWVIAAGLGLYATGITWFARRETEESRRLPLGLALIVMATGLALLASFPAWETVGLQLEYGLRFDGLGKNWYLLWSLLGMSIGYRAVLAVIAPDPWRVQAAVKHSILSIVVLDAVVCFAAHGPTVPTFSILLLLAPAMFLGRWIYST